jgi:hypothetical protein
VNADELLARHNRDRLADMMADGCPTLVKAFATLGIPRSTGARYWRRICRDLGAQAR